MRARAAIDRRAWWLGLGLTVLPLAGCTPKSGGDKVEPASTGPAAVPLQVTSTAFGSGAEIPKSCTCEGGDGSPPLAWSGLPTTTKSIALVVDDPDAPDPKAPKTTWVHWVLYDLPPTASGLEQAVKALPEGTREGLNDWKRTGYGGPCPPIGRHRYFHKVYALDVVLPDLGSPTKADLEKAMAGHIVGKGELVGTYQKAPKSE
jgi:Raf kinase inhibitor-like YbhB/YbcL family protein